MRDRVKCFSEIEKNAQTAFLRCSEENQDLTIELFQLRILFGNQTDNLKGCSKQNKIQTGS